MPILSPRLPCARFRRWLMRSVAVLPFQNVTGDAQNSLYSDGVREDLIAQLAKISELRVVDLDPRKERQAAYFSSRETGSRVRGRLPSARHCSMDSYPREVTGETGSSRSRSNRMERNI